MNPALSAYYGRLIEVFPTHAGLAGLGETSRTAAGVRHQEAAGGADGTAEEASA